MDWTSWSAAAGDAVATLGDRVVTRLPDVAAAAAIILFGWAVARLLSAILRRLLGRTLERLEAARLLRGEDRLGLRRSLPALVGGVTFWTVMTVAVVAATDALGLALLGELLATVARILPQVLAGVLVVFGGFVIAELAQGAVARAAGAAGLPYGGVLARALQLAIMVVALVMGADQAGIDSTFLMIALPVVLGALLAGAALAFGLGSRTAVSNIIAAHQLARFHEVGQRVRVAGLEGRIEEILPAAVVLEGAEGRVVVPAQIFSEEVTVILGRAES